MRPSTFAPVAFDDYALLDSGGAEKLERFGDVVLRRPDPQALWRPRLERARWDAADLTFVRESDRGGRWRKGPDPAPPARSREPAWNVRFGQGVFRVQPTPFKHVGLFPEQAANWAFVADRARELGEGASLLNLFGYTGAASVLAAQAGMEVTHVDASKASVTWTRENAVLSGLGERALRLVVDDALAFAQREVRRGRRYAGVLLDPPHYGRGPKGEKWQFEDGFSAVLEAVTELLEPRAFLVLSTYAIGFSPLAFWNVLSQSPGLEGGEVSAGELVLPEEESERVLPCGFCARWQRDG